MNDSSTMGSLQRTGDLSSQLEHLLYRQRLAIHVLLERLAFEQLHDEELLPLVFSHVVNRADMRIVQRGCRACFALEPLLRTGFCDETRRQNLDGYVSSETRVGRPVNLAHPAGPQKCPDFIGSKFCACTDRHTGPRL